MSDEWRSAYDTWAHTTDAFLAPDISRAAFEAAWNAATAHLSAEISDLKAELAAEVAIRPVLSAHLSAERDSPLRTVGMNPAEWERLVDKYTAEHDALLLAEREELREALRDIVDEFTTDGPIAGMEPGWLSRARKLVGGQ